MPKEVVHWMVAERAGELLSGSAFGPALARCPNGLKLGAVLHDALFYLRGEHPAGLKHLPHRLHGAHGEDSFDILRLQAAHIRANQGQPLPAAVFVGLASHIFADAALHPLVYYLTGNYYDADERERTKAIQRHRALEGLMDMVAAGPEGAGETTVLGRSLKAVVSGLEGPVSLAWPPEGLARLAGCAPDAAKKALDESLGTYQTMQALCRVQTLARLLREFSVLLPDSLKEIAALFYAPQLYEQRAALAGSLEYRNPATGEGMRASLAELMERAARNTASFCLAQASTITSSGALAGEGVGPSLDMGLPGMPVGRAEYFSSRRLPAD